MIEKTSALIRIAILIAAFSSVACDRAIEPFDPDEEPQQPDLSRIFPAGGSEARPGGDASGGGVMGGRSARGNLPPKPDSQPAGSGATIRGAVEIDAGLVGAITDQAVLFIIARRPGGGGPPLAVIRETQPRFPYEFEIGQANVMIPSLRFEGDILLTARLDSDGNATTKLPGDLAGSVDRTLSPGEAGVRVVLDQKL